MTYRKVRFWRRNSALRSGWKGGHYGRDVGSVRDGLGEYWVNGSLSRTEQTSVDLLDVIVLRSAV